MYGEKIEENDELRLDLIDVKEMYKAQVRTWKLIIDLISDINYCDINWVVFFIT